jgi:hypothetical protein
MKLPPRETEPDTYYAALIDAAQKIAVRLTLQSGTVVKAAIRPLPPEGGWMSYDWTNPNSELEHELVFYALGKAFPNLKEVKKALKLKAFL